MREKLRFRFDILGQLLDPSTPGPIVDSDNHCANCMSNVLWMYPPHMRCVLLRLYKDRYEWCLLPSLRRDLDVPHPGSSPF